MHVSKPYDWSACRTNCENKANELGKAGCCMAKSKNGYCVFVPGTEPKVSSMSDLKAVLCSGNFELLNRYLKIKQN